MLTKKDGQYLLILVGLLMLCIIVLLISNNKRNSSEPYKIHGVKNILIILAGNSISEQDNKKINEMKDVKIDIIEFDSPPDISPNGWNQLTSIIAQQYNKYNAFVIFHQPETLTYTASALSFMLENLGKTVVIASDSYFSVLRLVCSYSIPEVVVVNGTAILRACRTKKIKDKYISPNFPQLGKLSDKITINEKMVLTYPKKGFNPITVDPNKRVAVIKLYPGIDDNYIRNVIKTGRIYAIILESYNNGYISLNKNIITYLHELAKTNTIIVSVSQDMNDVTNRDMENMGVISARNMTTEAVMAKLSLIISNVKYNHDMVVKLIQLSMRGEV